MRRIYLSVSCLLMMVFISCSDRELTIAQLEQYMLDPENGLLKEVVVNDIKLQVIYKPKDLILAQHLQGIADTTERKQIINQLDSLDYFVFRFSKNGKELENGFVADPVRFNEVIDYLGFYMNQDIHLISKTDTLPAIDVMYVRTFGAGEATNVLTVFKSALQYNRSDVTLRFDDNKLSTGINEFNFEINRIRSIPKIKSDQL